MPSVRHAWNSGAVSVHPAKRRELVAGQATVALEMLDQAKAGDHIVFMSNGGFGAGPRRFVTGLEERERI